MPSVLPNWIIDEPDLKVILWHIGLILNLTNWICLDYDYDYNELDWFELESASRWHLLWFGAI